MVTPSQPEPEPQRRQPLLHQAADPADLAQHPPVGSACGRIRHLLRDFVDGDLEVAEQATVEAHVHQCRACGVALSRAELEIMRIRRAFGELDPSGLEPSPGFTASVLSQVGWQEVKAPDLQPPAGFTADVMAEVLAELAARRVETSAGETLAGETLAGETLAGEISAGETSSSGIRGWRPSFWWRSKAIPVVAAAGLLIAAVLGVLRWPGPELRPDEVVRVQSASRRIDDPAGARAFEPLRSGQVLAAGDVCVVEAEGSLELRLAGSPGRQSGVRAGPASELQVVADGLRVMRGEVRLDVAEAMSVAVERAGRLELGRGQYELSAARVRHQDQQAGIRAQLTVLEGVAKVVRGREIEVIEPDQLVTWNSFGDLRVDVAPDRSMFVASVANAVPVAKVQEPPSPAAPRWVGELLDASTSRPVAGSTVTLRTVRGSQSVVSDANGTFQFDVEDLDGEFGVLSALPAALPTGSTAGGTPGLCELLPVPVRLRRAAGEERRFYLRPERVLRGQLLAADSRPVDGATVMACLVDELFGLIAPIRSAVVKTDRRGNFVLRGLRTAWPMHHSVLVFAQQPGQRPQIVLARTGVRAVDSALQLRLAAPRQVTLRGVSPDTEFHLLLPVLGLPIAWGAFVQTVRSDASGRVRVDVSGPVYVLGAAGPPRRLDTSRDVVGFRTVGAPGMPVPVAGVRIPQWAPLWSSERTTSGMRWFVRPHRFDGQLLPVVGRGGVISVRAATTGLACYGSQLFVVEAGVPRFLGVYEGHLRCDASVLGQLVTVTPDGWVGRLRLVQPLGRRRLELQAEAGGLVVRGAVDRRRRDGKGGVLALSRVTAAGLWPVYRELLDQTWPVLAGEYRLGGATLRVAPGGTVTLPARKR